MRCLVSPLTNPWPPLPPLIKPRHISSRLGAASVSRSHCFYLEPTVHNLPKHQVRAPRPRQSAGHGHPPRRWRVRLLIHPPLHHLHAGEPVIDQVPVLLNRHHQDPLPALHLHPRPPLAVVLGRVRGRHHAFVGPVRVRRH